MNSLLEIVRKRAYKTNVAVTLASGQASNFYVDCKQLSLHGPSLRIVGAAFKKKLAELDSRLTHVAGVSVGGDPLVAGILWQAAEDGLEWNGLLVRKEKKKHGATAGRAVEGDPSASGQRVWLVEDVISTGGSSLSAAQNLREEGYDLQGIVTLVDRQMGGVEKLTQDLKIPVLALLTAKEIIG